ncbi:MAG: hypothetical protein H7061_09005 [Bdellovibrionaceae bacterium]|nr:hypothetical protein [Bdellovibrio sp.]
MIKKFLLVATVIFISGCATYQSTITPARDHLVGGRCPEALKFLEVESAKQNGDQLVYLLDYGTALQICGDFKKSSQVFINADQLSEQMDYHSASRVAGATLLNEEMIQYKGDTFEKLFINAVAALNYLELGETDEALVEVRRINEKFRKLQSDDKKKFELNPFSQYLSGLIYELDHRYDDACISYKSAYQLDPTYRGIALDMLRGCWLARRTQEFDLMVKEIGPTADELKKIKTKNKNEVLIVFMQGWGPRKAPRSDNHLAPYLVPVTSITRRLKAEVAGVDSIISEPVYDVEQAAIKTLNDDYASLVTRRIGSRVAKEVIADQVRQKDQLLGNIAWLVMVASERADLRQWSTLPQTIQLIRIPLLAGTHKIKLTGLDSANNTSEALPELEVKTGPGQKKLYVVRSLK